MKRFMKNCFPARAARVSVNHVKDTPTFPSLNSARAQPCNSLMSGDNKNKHFAQMTPLS